MLDLVVMMFSGQLPLKVLLSQQLCLLPLLSTYQEEMSCLGVRQGLFLHLLHRQRSRLCSATLLLWITARRLLLSAFTIIFASESLRLGHF